MGKEDGICGIGSCTGTLGQKATEEREGKTDNEKRLG